MRKGLFLLCFLVGCVARTPAPVVVGSGGNSNIGVENTIQSDMEIDNSPRELTIKPFISEEKVETNEIKPIALEEIKTPVVRNVETSPATNVEKYIVMKQGDTLYSIAKANGTTVEKLKSDNGIVDHTNISTGQKIYISNGGEKPAYEATPNYKEESSYNKKPVYNKSASNQKTRFVFPVKGGEIIRKFGENQGGFKNDGINIAANSGDPIKAAENGEVIYIGNELRDYGNLTIIRHNGSLVTSYSHADFFVVKKGDTVKKGDIIGYVGESGAVASSQLHFAVRKNNKAIDPMKYL